MVLLKIPYNPEASMGFANRRKARLLRELQAGQFREIERTALFSILVISVISPSNKFHNFSFDYLQRNWFYQVIVHSRL